MKMTLDNPAVLEQKLEALEHHKKVLENQQARRLQLAAAGGGSAIGSGTGPFQKKAPGAVINAGVPSSATLPGRSNGGAAGTTNSNSSYTGSIYENQHMLYENMKQNGSGAVYGTYPAGGGGATAAASPLIYSNILHGKNSSVATASEPDNPYSNLSYDVNSVHGKLK